MTDNKPGSLVSRAFSKLWGKVKTATNQTNEPGKEGTLLGRTLVQSLPHPIIQVAVPIVDPIFAALWDRVVDPNKETPTEMEFKEALKDSLLNNRDGLKKHYIGVMNYVFKRVDLPLVDGPLEEYIEKQAEKAVDDFIQDQLDKLK